MSVFLEVIGQTVAKQTQYLEGKKIDFYLTVISNLRMSNVNKDVYISIFAGYLFLCHIMHYTCSNTFKAKY